MSKQQGIGHNSGELSEDHKRALAYHHKKAFEAALKVKKDADAAFKNECKTIKAEGTSIDDIKDLIRLDSPEGENGLKVEVERHIRNARWAGAEFGTQFSLLEQTDRAPLDERAYHEGKKAGMEATERKSPYTGTAEGEWLRGYADGQAILMEALDLTKAGMKQIAEEAEAKAKEATEKKPKKGAKPLPPEPGKTFKDQLEKAA